LEEEVYHLSDGCGEQHFFDLFAVRVVDLSTMRLIVLDEHGKVDYLVCLVKEENAHHIRLQRVDESFDAPLDRDVEVSGHLTFTLILGLLI
jgi:hypothetical protein